MKLGKLHGTLAALSLVVVFAVAGNVAASDVGGAVKKACTTCHSAKRICLNVGVKTEAMWKANVAKMVRKGAKLPAGQVDAAAAYLAGLKPGQGEICR